MPSEPDSPNQKNADDGAPANGAPASNSASSATAVKERPAPARVDQLPPFRVLLHNDDVNDIVYVVETIVDLTPLNIKSATEATFEAHEEGVALLLVTHRERAELYVEQFKSKNLTVTMESAE